MIEDLGDDELRGRELEVSLRKDICHEHRVVDRMVKSLGREDGITRVIRGDREVVILRTVNCSSSLHRTGARTGSKNGLPALEEKIRDSITEGHPAFSGTPAPGTLDGGPIARPQPGEEAWNTLGPESNHQPRSGGHGQENLCGGLQVPGRVAG